MIRIFKKSLSSSSDSPEVLTAELGQQTSPGRRGFGLKSSGHRSPGGGASILANKRLTLPFLAFVAVLAAGLLFLLPGGLLQAQDDGTIEYPENGTDPVATFSSEDPDGDDITWAVSGTDGSLFEFSDDNPGELSFMASPDYESPAGGSGNDSNTYEITVTAADGNDGTATKEVMVKVTDVEERATIELSTRQPVVGQSLMATLKNDGEVASGVRWMWEKKDGATWVDATGTTTPVTEPSYTSTYTPVQNEIDAELRVGVEYIDTDGDNQTIAAVGFEQAVAASVGGTNADPMFTEGATAMRTIAENAAAGTAVGDPVTATDDHRTALTYTMVQATPAPTDDAPASFKIDPKTGQISVSASAKLNYDVATATDRTYILMVTVDDPDGGTAATITVTVTVTDVAEAPKVTGPATEKVNEDFDSEDGTDGRQLVVATYTGTDEAGDAIGLTLEGADAAAFGLTRITGGDDGGSYNLAFNTAPDFEKPADAGSNNEYQVMVVATDRGLKAMRSVVVRVANANEAGEIELTPEAPTVGKPVMAELSDEDVVQARTVTWLWSSKTDTTDCDDTDDTNFARGDRIAGATSDTYTPTAAECLRVTARYTDGHGGNKNAMATVVVEARTSNVPVFAEDDPIIRSVNENSDTLPTNVGGVGDAVGNPSPVVATDADTQDGGTDTLTYTIASVVPSSGAARFSIDNTGQLKAEEKLDHEEQASYMLEVKATDSTGNSAMVTVTVMLNDVNDDPGAIMDSRRNNDYPENGTDPVATFSSEDPDGDDITWAVSGTDGSLFEFSDDNPGELSFMASPDYESPAGGSGNDSNTYEITVTAADGNDGTATKEVMVKVTDVEERATIELSTRQPVVGRSLTATLTNDDEVASDVRWTWTGIEGETADSTSPSYSSTYMPLPGDANDRVRVGVKYIDTDGRDQTVAAVAFEQPVAPTLAADATNELPEFAEGATAMRTIAENAAAGTAVGDPVTATDDHRTALTYTMVQATPTPTDDAPASFKIDPKTGQISVSASAKLNYDPVGNTAAVREYTLTVSVADPDGATGSPATITVTVTVTDVAEAPKVTGPATEKVNEDFDSEDGTDGRQLVVATYTGTDEAGDAIGLTLEGADAAAFGLTRITGGDDGGSYNLAFNTAPDFEKPADTGSNNEYQVMVVATDRGLKAMRSVVVRVANANEAGEIELTPEAPTVGKPVMAELSDEDVVQARSVTWLWSSNDDTDCNAQTTFARGDRVAGATSDTYTPTAAECLRVTARYTDGHGGNKNAMATVVVEARTSNVPVFAEDDPIIRSVNENEDVGTNVGAVVMATDADTQDGGTDTLTYTIASVVPSSGAARFSIDNTGQVQTEDMLDHEEQASYMLEVKATDPSSNSAMVTVTVNVIDVNDIPEIVVGGLLIRGPSSIYYAETDNDVNAVAMYTLAGKMKDMATLSLEGDDAGDFRISSGGMLTFRSSPNYEMPMDANKDNTYMVTLKANDGTYMDTHDVTVMVTNVEEDGTVMLSSMTPVVGTAVMASLTDPDMVTEDTVTWQWSKSMTMGGTFMDIDEATMMNYTPVEADEGYYLRATATYTDGYDSGNEAMDTTTRMVITVQDQEGMVALSSMSPVVGVALTATLTDPDVVTEDTVMWQWSKSMTMDGTFEDIDGATMMTYTPVATEDATDVGYHLMATVTYTDGHGSGKTEMATTTNKVVADADALLVARYDTNGTPGIQKDEVIKAITDYLFGEGDAAISKADVISLITLYLFGG